MSKLITIAQKKGLRNIGFDFDSRCYCGGAMECVCEYMKDEHKLITVSEALDWIREEKMIECGVYPIMIPIRDGLRRMAYAHSAFDLNNNCKRLQLDVSLVKVDTHPLASSALLDAVLTYLEERTDV